MKLVRPVRATEPLDPAIESEGIDPKVIEAIEDFEDGLDLALAVAEKRIDPAVAVASCKRVKDYRAALIGRHDEEQRS